MSVPGIASIYFDAGINAWRGMGDKRAMNARKKESDRTDGIHIRYSDNFSYMARERRGVIMGIFHSRQVSIDGNAIYV